MSRVTDALGQATDELIAAVSAAGTPDEARAVIAAWGEDNAAFDVLGDALLETSARADMAGRLMVLGPEAKSIQLAAGDGGLPPKVDAFLDLPWEEALDAFRKRGTVKPTELAKLIRDYGQRSAEARRLMLENVQAKVRDMLDVAIEQGQTLPDFAQALDENREQLGIDPSSKAYVEMVFRTNVQSSYGAGRYAAMKDPDVMEARPYVEYRTSGDARVRDSHAALNGLVFRIDDPTWERIAPPNGYNCRCSAVTVSAKEFAAEGLTLASGIPDAYVPDPDFDSPPGAKLDA